MEGFYISLWQLLVVFGVPTGMFGLGLWFLKRNIDKKDKAREEREEQRKEYDTILLEQLISCTTLCEATAKAVQRIPDAHCNGDMTKALEYVKEKKNNRKDFFLHMGIEHLHEG